MAKKKRNRKDQVVRAEDVEFSNELADGNDREARQRGKRADKRAKKKK